MEIELPELNKILPRMMAVESHFDGKRIAISEWVDCQRQAIQQNLEFVQNPSDSRDIEILLSFLRDLLARAMSGEAVELTYRALKYEIKDKSNLNQSVYEQALNNANYRWGSKEGSAVIEKVVAYFGKDLGWKWQNYLEQAQKNRQNNFSSDHLLNIKNIGYKVRDLALSSFDPFFAAFDLHVARVPTRIGLLNYGYELLGDSKIEMGNNPADVKNYLFLHKLFIRLSDLTAGEYLPVDLDRIFWHFGRTYCGSEPKCQRCPINAQCLTGKAILRKSP